MVIGEDPLKKEPLKDLPEFDLLENMPEDQNHSLAFIGPRDSGKTFMISNYWKFFTERFDFIIIFCNNPQAKAYHFISEDQKKFIFRAYCPEILKDLDEFQSRTENFFKFMVIFDDCSSKQKNKFDTMVEQLFIRGRNINCTILFSTQSSGFITKDNRGNIDYLYIFRPKGELVEPMCERFLSYVLEVPPEVTSKVKRLNFMIRWLKERTLNRQVVVVDYKHNDSLYRYKAKALS